MADIIFPDGTKLADVVANINVVTSNPTTSQGAGEIIYNSTAEEVYVNIGTAGSPTWSDLGGSTGGSDDHSTLTNLNWAAAGHTIDINVSFGGYGATSIASLDNTTSIALKIGGTQKALLNTNELSLSNLVDFELNGDLKLSYTGLSIINADTDDDIHYYSNATAGAHYFYTSGSQILYIHDGGVHFLNGTITGLPDPITDTEPVTLGYFNTNKANQWVGTATSNLNMAGNQIFGVSGISDNAGDFQIILSDTNESFHGVSMGGSVTIQGDNNPALGLLKSAGIEATSIETTNLYSPTSTNLVIDVNGNLVLQPSLWVSINSPNGLDLSNGDIVDVTELRFQDINTYIKDVYNGGTLKEDLYIKAEGVITLESEVYMNDDLNVTGDVSGSKFWATAGMEMNNSKITGLATPAFGTDAATKAYVDSVGGGTSLWEVSGEYTQLITPDEINLQNYDIVGIQDIVFNISGQSFESSAGGIDIRVPSGDSVSVMINGITYFDVNASYIDCYRNLDVNGYDVYGVDVLQGLTNQHTTIRGGSGSGSTGDLELQAERYLIVAPADDVRVYEDLVMEPRVAGESYKLQFDYGGDLYGDQWLGVDAVRISAPYIVFEPSVSVISNGPFTFYDNIGFSSAYNFSFNEGTITECTLVRGTSILDLAIWDSVGGIADLQMELDDNGINTYKPILLGDIIDAKNKRITGLPSPVSGSDAISLSYFNANSVTNPAGGPLNMSGYNITNIGDLSSSGDLDITTSSGSTTIYSSSNTIFQGGQISIQNSTGIDMNNNDIVDITKIQFQNSNTYVYDYLDNLRIKAYGQIELESEVYAYNDVNITGDVNASSAYLTNQLTFQYGSIKSFNNPPYRMEYYADGLADHSFYCNGIPILSINNDGLDMEANDIDHIWKLKSFDGGYINLYTNDVGGTGTLSMRWTQGDIDVYRDLNMNNNTINMGSSYTPTTDYDVATKAYVDAHGGSNIFDTADIEMHNQYGIRFFDDAGITQMGLIYGSDALGDSTIYLHSSGDIVMNVPDQYKISFQTLATERAFIDNNGINSTKIKAPTGENLSFECDAGQVFVFSTV